MGKLLRLQGKSVVIEKSLLGFAAPKEPLRELNRRIKGGL
jgi:hypothetical protein